MSIVEKVVIDDTGMSAYFRDHDFRLDGEEVKQKLVDLENNKTDNTEHELLKTTVDSSIERIKKLDETKVGTTEYNTFVDRVSYDESNINTLIKGVRSLDGTKADAILYQTLKNRMDSFTALKSGSTTGDAELIDARNGSDGLTYQSLGESIRTQIKRVENSIKNLINNDKRVTFTFDMFEKGNVDLVTKEDIGDSSGKFYRSKFIPVTGKNYTLRTLKDSVKYMFLEYNAEKVLVRNWSQYYGGWNFGVITDEAAYIRIIVQNENGVDGDDISNLIFNMYNANNKLVNIRDYAVVGDGITDNTRGFKKAIETVNAVKGTLYIPTGRYVVSEILGTLTDCEVRGDFSSSDYYNGSVIIDKRPSHGAGDVDTFLLEMEGQFKISDITFLGGTNIKNCIKFAGGWESFVSRVCIIDYYNIGCTYTGMDITTNGLFVMGCGTRYTPDAESKANYAIELTNKANCLHFSNCHVEHCRLMLRSRSAFTNSFSSCKFEQSRWGIEFNIDGMTPINIIDSANITFNGCIFFSINRAAYIEQGVTPQHFITCNNSGTDHIASAVIDGGTIECGMGSGSLTTTGLQSAQFVKCIDNGSIVLTGNSIRYTSGVSAFILRNGSICQGNTISYVSEGSDNTGIFDIEKSIFVNNVLRLNGVSGKTMDATSVYDKNISI